MKLQKTMTKQKLRGGYYTPKVIRDFLVNWSLRSKGKSVLEPSCGDGGFFESLLEQKGNGKITKILGVEIDQKESQKAGKIIKKFKGVDKEIVNDDFFTFYNKKLQKKEFDIVLGNPPFIRYQYFADKLKTQSLKIMASAGMESSKLVNIWAPFVIGCMESLSKKGRLAMVIPAEILHVNYAADVRKFLGSYPAKISIITFEELVFPDVQQEVLLLLVEKNPTTAKSTSLDIIQLKNVQSLDSFDIDTVPSSKYKKIEATSDKWTKYFLSKQKLNEIKKIELNKKIKKLGSLAEVDVGTVTGANKFFVVNAETISEYDLKKVALPLVGRSMHIAGLIFGKEDWKKNVEKGIASHLLAFSDEEFKNYPKKMQEYIKLGEKLGIQNGYKTGIRGRWYQVPSIWNPDCFLLRRSHKFPKLILNKIGAHTTDTMHRVKIKPKIDHASLVFCFYNSVTLAYAELIGRSHGGGVLEILPDDAETILIPYKKISQKELKKIDLLFREEKNINQILDYVDEILLKKHLKLSDSTVKNFRSIREDLANKRMRRRN